MIKELSLSFSTPLPHLLPITPPPPPQSPPPFFRQMWHSEARATIETDRQRQKHRHKETQKETDADRQRHRDRETETQRETDADRQTDRQRQRQRSHTTSARRVDRRSTLACGDPVICTTASAGARRLHRGASTAGGPGLINKTQSTLDLPGPVVRQRKGAARGPAPIAMLCTLLWPQAAGRRRPGQGCQTDP